MEQVHGASMVHFKSLQMQRALSMTPWPCLHSGMPARAQQPKSSLCAISKLPHTTGLTSMLPCRSLANGMVIGTSEGFTKELSLIGVGYRGAVSGQKLTMNLGYSHPVEMDIPQGITVQVNFVLGCRHLAQPVGCQAACMQCLEDCVHPAAHHLHVGTLMQKCMETECALTNPVEDWRTTCTPQLITPASPPAHQPSIWGAGCTSQAMPCHASICEA